MTIPHLHYTPTYPPPFLRLPRNHVSEIYILQVWVTWTLSTPLHIVNGTQDTCNRHQPVDHRRIQHTTSHAAKPHSSWCTNPPTERHRHSQAADTGRWPQWHLHIPTPYPALRATDSTHFAIFILSFSHPQKARLWDLSIRPPTSITLSLQYWTWRWPLYRPKHVVLRLYN